VNEKGHGVGARIYKNAAEASYEAQLKEAKAELQAQKVVISKETHFMVGRASETTIFRPNPRFWTPALYGRQKLKITEQRCEVPSSATRISSKSCNK